MYIISSIFSLSKYLRNDNIGHLVTPNQKNIYGAAQALIAIVYGIIQGIIAVASLLATMVILENGRDPQWYMSGISNMYNSFHFKLIGQPTTYLE